MQGEAGETEAAVTKEARIYEAAEAQLERALARVKKAEDVLEKWEEDNQGFNIGNSDYRELKAFLQEAQEGLKIANQVLKDAKERWQEARAAVENLKAKESKKKKRRIDVQVTSQGPVPKEFCMVPMDTITAYQELIQQFQRSSDDFSRPLYLLYGPRQFGKTTLTYRLAEEIQLDSSIEVIYLRFDPSLHSSEEFWRAVGAKLDEEHDISSSDDLINVLKSHRKRLCLFLDEMDAMFDNRSLTQHFISTLSVWQGSKFFHGFLGVGSYNLVELFQQVKGGDKVSPFNLSSLVKVEPFTIQQMDNFFDEVNASYQFTCSTRLAIMDYSSGAPGVFGSLIRFTIDGNKWKCEADEWQTWFKIQEFSEYLHRYNQTYKRIQSDLLSLGEGYWKALNYVLLHQEANSSSEPNALPFGKLLQMGVLIQATDNKVRFASEMMRRICMEAQPVREIDLMLSEDSPLELLSVSLRSMRPNIIGHALVANRQSPSEAVFQFELYAAMRAILQRHHRTRKVLAEARTHGEKRLDIAIKNGSSYGFELKSNKLTRGDIEAAVEQADVYKRHLGIDKMFVVNFVPRIHVMDPVFQMDTFSDIKVIHVFYPDTYDEYELKFLGDNGEMQSRKVRSMSS